MEELLAKYFAGEASIDEIKEVEDWRNASKEQAESYLEAKKIWLASAVQKKPNNQHFLDIVGPQPKSFPLYQQFFKYAAALILISGIVFLVYKYAGIVGEGPYEIIANEMTVEGLPDGSEVTLEKGSRLVVGNFEEGRSVVLSGRAYFDITEDKSKPFIVETESARVQVTGTSFVVNSTNESETKVIVESGSVDLYQNPKAFNGSNMMVSLTQGEIGELVVGQKGIRKKKVKDQNYLAWKTGFLSFKNTNMNQVAEVLEDIYGVEVEFKNNAIRLCRLTANYKEKTSDEVLSYITQTFDFDYSVEGNKVVFSGPGCR